MHSLNALKRSFERQEPKFRRHARDFNSQRLELRLRVPELHGLMEEIELLQSQVKEDEEGIKEREKEIAEATEEQEEKEASAEQDDSDDDSSGDDDSDSSEDEDAEVLLKRAKEDLGLKKKKLKETQARHSKLALGMEGMFKRHRRMYGWVMQFLSKQVDKGLVDGTDVNRLLGSMGMKRPQKSEYIPQK